MLHPLVERRDEWVHREQRAQGLDVIAQLSGARAKDDRRIACLELSKKPDTQHERVGEQLLALCGWELARPCALGVLGWELPARDLREDRALVT